MKALTLISGLLLLTLCSNPSEDLQKTDIQVEKSEPSSFNDYWKKGGAEITSYELEQARYGEIHKGKAVTVFVTEPFSKSKQVKLDDYKAAGDDRVNVMKLNMTKNFITGIYPYSMMLSTFTPLDYSPMIKSTTSSQEWCGHTFMQLNQQDSGYQWNGYSYFESEGDGNGIVSNNLTEDEIWTKLRLNPKLLPLGEIELLPSTFYLRLRHQEIAPKMATATLTDFKESEFALKEHSAYSLDYGDRKLTIYFESTIPNQILGWEETHMSGFGNAIELTTKAKRIHTIRSKYWGKNSNADRTLRDQLGLRVE